MATPGWYPDPAGRPGASRYWDGQAWGSEVTDRPHAERPYADAPATAPAAAPTAFQSYERDPAQPTWAPAPQQPSGPPGQRPGAGTVVGLLLLGLLATIMVGVVTFFVVRSF